MLNGNEWSNEYKLPKMEVTLYDFYVNLTALINDEFYYPIELSQTYANMILMKYVFNTGIDLYIKGDDGKMHKLDIELQYDNNNKLQDIKVQICN